MIFRQNQRMSPCGRTEVQNHPIFLILIQRIGRNLSVRYFTENTSFVSHVYLSFCRLNGNDSHPLPTAGIRSRSLHAPGPLSGKSSHVAQKKGCEKTAQQSPKMRRIIHPHTLEPGIQRKKNHQSHPLHRDAGRSSLSRNHQIKQSAISPKTAPLAPMDS